MGDIDGLYIQGEYQYEGLTMGRNFPAEHLDKLKQFQFREDDILVPSYLKAGTTWLQEILYLINTGGDFKTAATLPCMARIPYIDLCARKAEDTDAYDGLAFAEMQTQPRILKTHLEYRFYEKTFQTVKPRVIVVMRNLKDSLVSYFHFYRAMKFFNFRDGEWDQFFERYRRQRLFSGDWFDFNLSWWKNRNDPNVLFLTYEDMKNDIHSVITSICDFLDKPISEELLDKIVEYTSFDQMKDNKMANYEFCKTIDQSVSKFVRKGKIGDWVNYFSNEQAEFVDEQLKDKLQGSGLGFQELYGESGDEEDRDPEIKQ